MENELIQWPKSTYWDKCFNPVIGCEEISEGCQNCYAAEMVKRFGMNAGCFAPEFMPKAKPAKSGVVFVGNMTDIFGHWVPSSQLIEWIFSLPHNKDVVNLILTKRSARMKEIILDCCHESHWFGVTCENQARANERIPDLLSINVPHRWLSLEPLLGEIEMQRYIAIDNYYPVKCNNCGWIGSSGFCPGNDEYYTCPECFTGEPIELDKQPINWVVVGAESGPNRRECKIKWIEHIVEQCQVAGVPVFVKQIHIDGKLVDDINKFPEHLRIRQIPWKI